MNTKLKQITKAVSAFIPFGRLGFFHLCSPKFLLLLFILLSKLLFILSYKATLLCSVPSSVSADTQLFPIALIWEFRQ